MFKYIAVRSSSDNGVYISEEVLGTCCGKLLHYRPLEWQHSPPWVGDSCGGVLMIFICRPPVVSRDGYSWVSHFDV